VAPRRPSPKLPLSATANFTLRPTLNKGFELSEAGESTGWHNFSGAAMQRSVQHPRRELLDLWKCRHSAGSQYADANATEAVSVGHHHDAADRMNTERLLVGARRYRAAETKLSLPARSP
jgi:hypothetical protein